MSAFAEHRFATCNHLVDEKFAVDKLVFFKVFDSVEPFCLDFGNIGSLTEGCEERNVARFGNSIFFIEIGKNIAHAQAVSAHFVGVCRTDALSGCPDFCIAFELFVGSVEETVGGHNEVGFARNFQHFLDVNTALLEVLCFVAEQNRVEHHAVADNINLPVLENAGWN